MINKRLPELLCPAGDMDAFEAAIEGGADAIYVGGASFNARINAKNFSREELAQAIKLAHAYGVKVYQTVNIMVRDREMGELLRAAECSAEDGIDAFIVSDLGAARALRMALPEIPLHASTQMSVHNSMGARLLADHGFTRVVPARELSHKDIVSLVNESPLEVEIFIHGALCVSHSGQCLFSSLVGGRSGNRGLCAQPCRLPFGCDGRQNGSQYPLSLKDLSLAPHVREIIDSGVASLKIEGRMKSADYVFGVSRIWRRLLDEGRNATPDEMAELSGIFSRGGFTDGYFTNRIGRGMLGVRSEEDKRSSRDVAGFDKITRKRPIDMKISLREGEASRLVLSLENYCVEVCGASPVAAINAPIDLETVKKQLSKLGDTPFCLGKLDADIEGRLMMPISALNALRRDAVEALTSRMSEIAPISKGEYVKGEPCGEQKRSKIARFLDEKSISDSAREYFDKILLPLNKYIDSDADVDGFVMPPIVFDSETDGVVQMLERALEKSPTMIVAANIGQGKMLRELFPKAELVSDFRFNVANDGSMIFLEELGYDSSILSAELTLPQIRDIKGSKAVISYGRLPLMTIEKCVIKELYGKNACKVCECGEAQLTDRRGVSFPIVRESEHRNVILNSLPTCMSDRQSELVAAGAVCEHFIFTTESSFEVDEVIEAYKKGTSLDRKTRRIGV